MKTNRASRRGQLPGARFNRFHALAAAGLLLSGLCIATRSADQILLNAPLLSAPSANYSYYGMYSPYATAASFTLDSSYFIGEFCFLCRMSLLSAPTKVQTALKLKERLRLGSGLRADDFG